jgi:hypothetical protein
MGFSWELSIKHGGLNGILMGETITVNMVICMVF